MNSPKQPDNSTLVQTVPPPQTVRGVLTSTGLPIYRMPAFSVPSSIASILSRNHLMAALSLNVNETSEVFDYPLPFKLGTETCLFEALLNTGVFITTALSVTFWLNAPAPVTGKFLIEYAQDDEGDFGDKNQSSKIEWDVSGLKTLTVPIVSSCSGLKKLSAGVKTAGNINGPDYYSPGFRFTDNILNLGRMRMTLKSPLQGGSIFPDTYNLYIFMAFVNPQLSTVRTYRTVSGSSFIKYVTFR